MHRVLAWAALLFTTVAWASSLIIAKIVQPEVPPIHFVALRYTLAVPFMAASFAVLGEARRRSTSIRGQWRVIAIVGFTGPFLSQVLQYIGLSLTTAAETLMLLNTSPVFTLVLAAILLREPVTGRKVTGLVLALVGTCLIVMGGAPVNWSVGGPRLIGDLIVILSTFLFAVNGISGKVAVRASDSIAVTFYSTVVFVPLMWITALVFEGTSVLNRMSPASWFLVLWVAVVNTAIAYVFYYESMRYIEASLVQIALNLIVVWGVVMSIFILGEHSSWIQLLGGGLTLLGVVVAQLAMNRSVALSANHQSSGTERA